MTVIVALLAQLLHLGLMILAAPTVAGALDWLEARLSGRSGPPLLLPWRDLVRLSRKTPMAVENVSARRCQPPPWYRRSPWGWPARRWPTCWSWSRC